MQSVHILNKLFSTLEYIKLKGKLIAIDSSHTKIILRTTRLRVLLRPNRIGYLNDKYRSMEIVQRCIILAVQNSTSKQIHTRQCTDFNGKYPKGMKNEEKDRKGKKRMCYLNITGFIHFSM